MFHWAQGRGLVDHDPTAGVPRPRPRHRGPEALPSAGDLEKILTAASPALGAVLVCLYDTGARPGEVVRVTAKDFHPDARVWLLAEHKTAAKTGRPRVIHLTDRVLGMCRERAESYPTGPLFRNPRGNPWSSAKRISNAFRDLRTKLGLPKSVVPYSLRHEYISTALAEGVPDSVVAALVGHAGTRMIHQTYNHVASYSRVLQEAVQRIRRT